MDVLIAAMILGGIGGLMGAIFIIINNKVNHLRKKYLKLKWMKIAECIFLTIITASIMYIATYVRYERNLPDSDTDPTICYPINSSVKA